MRCSPYARVYTTSTCEDKARTRVLEGRSYPRISFCNRNGRNDASNRCCDYHRDRNPDGKHRVRLLHDRKQRAELYDRALRAERYEFGKDTSRRCVLFSSQRPGARFAALRHRMSHARLDIERVRSPAASTRTPSFVGSTKSDVQCERAIRVGGGTTHGTRVRGNVPAA